MIRLLQEGTYKLIETKGQTKMLFIDDSSTFAWINAKEIGEILVTSHKPHNADCILALGSYRIYAVENEPKLSDQIHLELYVGRNIWQGSLLPNGLPTDTKKRNRIIPTKEVISKNGISECYGVDE